MRLQGRHDVLEYDVVLEFKGSYRAAAGVTTATTVCVVATPAAPTRVASGQVEGEPVRKHECWCAHTARVALPQVAKEEMIVVAWIYGYCDVSVIDVLDKLHGDDLR